MPLFKDAESTSAYAKFAILGFAGGGKTFTAAQISIGLVHMMRKAGLEAGNRPVYFLDSETGSDFLLRQYREADVRLMTFKSRAFSDILLSIEEAQASGSVLIIDSVSHFWIELIRAYMAKKNRKRLLINDWGELKEEWGKFTSLFTNAPLHMLCCGRATDVFENYVDEAGAKQMEKVDVKMAAEKNFAYESSLLIEMSRRRGGDGKQERVAKIWKDRFDIIDGKEFVNPTFKDFLPHVALLNIGGTHMGVDLSRTSEEMIAAPQREYTKERVEATLGELLGLMDKHAAGQTAEAKSKRRAWVEKHFGVFGWEAVTQMSLDKLRSGLDSMCRELEGKPYYEEVSDGR